MTELKKKIEALLFSSGRRMGIDEISALCKSSHEEAKQALGELKKEYENSTSSLMIFDEGDFWKLTVREPFLPLVQKIVTQTELSKTLMETLAVIAFKYPIKQSDLIKIRTNKAYDHLNELEQMGYITRQKHGRTKLIKLSQKFFDYFNLPPDRLKETFSTFEGIANAIEEKEAEIKRLKEERRKEMEDAKKKEEEMKKAAGQGEPEIDLIAENGSKERLEVYEEPEEQPKTEIIDEKIGKLDVIDEIEQEPEEIEEAPKEAEADEEQPESPYEEEAEEGEEKVQKLVKDILSEDEEEKQELPAQDSEVDKRVEELLSGKGNEPEEAEEEKDKKKENQEEEKE